MVSLLRIMRKVNDGDPISIKVTFPTSYDLTSLPVTFWMDANDGTPKVVGASATAEDITPAGAAAQTVWRLSYVWGATDLDTKGDYKAEFQVDFGGGIKGYYPKDSDVIINVISHPAAT